MGKVAKREKAIRDPVHGDVFIGVPDELSVIDSIEFQRLRGIRQLGTAYFVYPCALHTRFDHSLGSMAAADRIIRAMERLTGEEVVSEEDERVLRLSALLHDVSHMPFGHFLEDERNIFERHDSPSAFARFFNRGELASALRRIGLAREVESVLCGTHERRFLSEILTGGICADLIDYLSRDSYFCGMTHGYDPRILRYFRIDGGELYIDCQKDGYLRHDVMSEIVNLLRLKCFLSERIYFHHAVMAAGAMISKAVDCAIRKGLDRSLLFSMTDEGLLSYLEMRFGDLDPVGGLVGGLRRRRLYKRCYSLTGRIGPLRQEELIAGFHIDRDRREEAERGLAKRLHVREGDLIISCPSSNMSLTEADVKVKTDGNPPVRLSSLGIPEIGVLRDRQRDLWRFCVFMAPHLSDRVKQISRVCEDYFGERNQLEYLQSGQSFFEF